MKKFMYVFALAGLLAITATAVARTYEICGHICEVDDADDYDFWVSYYCEPV